MARSTSAKHAGRTLTIFFVAMVIMYGLVALAGSWKPELGLDLQGGTRITLTAKGNPSTESLNEARSIIDQRVNGSGVTEAEVTTQGGRFIDRRDPGRAPPRPDRDRQAAGPAAVPAGGLHRRRARALRRRRRHGCRRPGNAPDAPTDEAPLGIAPPAAPSGGANRPPVSFSDNLSQPAPSDTPSPSDEASPSDGAVAERRGVAQRRAPRRARARPRSRATSARPPSRRRSSTCAAPTGPAVAGLQLLHLQRRRRPARR